MTTDQEPASEVLLYIEKEGPETYKIQSDQLERIGEKLRGPRHFSVFNSIILPLIVSVATIVFTTLLQFISWNNSVRLQNATDVASKAAENYEKAAGAIDQRVYSTFLFVPSLRDLIRAKHDSAKPNEMLAGSSDTTGYGGNAVSGPAVVRPLPNSPKPDPEVSLNKFDLDLKKHRFESYYDHLRRWNENYDQLLTEVDYALDRPVLLHADKAGEGIRVFAVKLKKLNCALSLTEQLGRLGLNPDSLKLRLAGINHCFIQVHAILDEKSGKALGSAELVWDDALSGQLKQKLGDIKTMANEFRCYALRRIDYYNRQKERSILSPVSLWKWLANSQKQEALVHFNETAEQCNRENRPT
jgi:hypothetical protein